MTNGMMVLAGLLAAILAVPGIAVAEEQIGFESSSGPLSCYTDLGGPGIKVRHCCAGVVIGDQAVIKCYAVAWQWAWPLGGG